MSEPRSGFQRFAAFLDDYHIDIALFAVPLILGASGFLISDEAIGVIDSIFGLSDRVKEIIRDVCFIGIIIFTSAHIVVFILHRRRERTLSELDTTISELRAKNEALEADNIRWAQEIKTLVSGHLFLLGRDVLDFGTHENNTERITLYVHDPEGYFIPVGRFSSNTAYGKRGRLKYPDTEGCIGIAWEHEEHFANDYPDPEKDLNSYVDRCNRDGMDREVVLNLHMKSRLL